MSTEDVTVATDEQPAAEPVQEPAAQPEQQSEQEQPATQEPGQATAV